MTEAEFRSFRERLRSQLPWGPEDRKGALNHITSVEGAGNADSHLDALCQVIFDGELYNEVAADTVGEGGAAELSVGLAADGIVGRGVLLDVPRSRGVPWREPGDCVTTFAYELGVDRRPHRGRTGPRRPPGPRRHPARPGRSCPPSRLFASPPAPGHR